MLRNPVSMTKLLIFQVDNHSNIYRIRTKLGIGICLYTLFKFYFLVYNNFWKVCPWRLLKKKNFFESLFAGKLKEIVFKF